MQKQFLSRSYAQTLALGKRLSRQLNSGDIICLFGQLGCGKTVLAKGIAQGLGLSSRAVNSPTFTFFNVYHGKKILYHFDLYRIEKEQELLGIGIADFLYGDGICVVEWADKLGSLLPKEYLKILITHQGANVRRFKLCSHGDYWQRVIKNFQV